MTIKIIDEMTAQVKNFSCVKLPPKPESLTQSLDEIKDRLLSLKFNSQGQLTEFEQNCLNLINTNSSSDDYNMSNYWNCFNVIEPTSQELNALQGLSLLCPDLSNSLNSF